MSYSPDYLASRRNAQSSRRRSIVVVSSLILACGIGGSLYFATQTTLVTGAHGKSDTPVGPSVTFPSSHLTFHGALRAKSSKAEMKSTSKLGRALLSNGSKPLLRSGASRSFAKLASSLPGRIELALTPLGLGKIEVLGSDAPAHGWSTTKVPVLVALLKAREQMGTSALTPQEDQWAQAAITESDNASILSLFGDLQRLKGGLAGASLFVQGLLRESGDKETVVTTAPPPPGAVTTFGQTEWRPSEADKFFRQLARGCLLPANQTNYVLGLMSHVESSESWGLGSAGFTSVAFKGGWGPDLSGAYLVRQSGIIDADTSRGVVVSIVAFPNSGSFSDGVQMLDDTSVWLHHELLLAPRTMVGCPK
jgi:hypothetical protein